MPDDFENSAVAATADFTHNLVEVCWVLLLDDTRLAQQVRKLAKWTQSIDHLLGFTDDCAECHIRMLLYKACLILAV